MRKNGLLDWIFMAFLAGSLGLILISTYGFFEGWWSGPRKNPEYLSALGFISVVVGVSGLLSGGYSERSNLDLAKNPTKFWMFTGWLFATGVCELFIGVVALSQF